MDANSHKYAQSSDSVPTVPYHPIICHHPIPTIETTNQPTPSILPYVPSAALPNNRLVAII